MARHGTVGYGQHVPSLRASLTGEHDHDICFKGTRDSLGINLRHISTTKGNFDKKIENNGNINREQGRESKIV